MGTGLFLTSSALFFTQSVGLSPTAVGVGLTTAALAGLLAGVPIGHLADRWGPRQAWVATLTGEAVAMATFVLVHSFWLFLLIACLSQMAGAGGGAARAALLHRLGGDDPRWLRAYVRSVLNLGMCLGAVAAGVAVQLNTRSAYVGLVLGNAATFIACAALLLLIPRTPPLPAPASGSRLMALRDLPYMTVTVINGIMCLQEPVLTFALPLWIVNDTTAPRGLVGAIVATNTLLVVLFQIRASRSVSSPQMAGRAIRAASFALLAGFTLMALASRVPAWAAATLLMAGVVAQTFGEVRQGAGAMELSFGLAPAHAQGEYGGIFGMGLSLAYAGGPVLLSVLCLDWKIAGWLVLGGLMVAAGVASPYAVRWAERSRPFVAQEQVTA